MIKASVNLEGNNITGIRIKRYVACIRNIGQKLTKVATATIIDSNNTPHAYQRCAPWGVTFFRNNKTRQGYAASHLRKGTPKPAGFLFMGVWK